MNLVFKFLVKKALKIEKRMRFVISTLLLSSLMLVATFFFFDKVYVFALLFIILSYAMTYFAIIEGVEKIEWFTLFLMPVLISLSFYFFYFLFPIRWLTRIPFIAIYTISIYANLLVSNIFNVRVERSLQLYRAAFSVNFFFQTLAIFLMLNSVFAFHFGSITNFVFATVLSFILSLQLYWSIKTLPALNKQVQSYSILTALVIGQIALVFSFTPVPSTILALFLAASYYSLSALIYSYLDERLFKETIREYLFVWIFVFIITVLSI